MKYRHTMLWGISHCTHFASERMHLPCPPTISKLQQRRMFIRTRPASTILITRPSIISMTDGRVR